MSINQTHLPFAKFIGNEVATLGVLQGLPHLAENFGNLFTEAFRYYNIYEGKRSQKRLDQTTFEFRCNFDLSIENGIRKFFLECTVSPDFSLTTYMLAICLDDDDETPEIIRKFHFDYAVPQADQTAKPVYHLQYGGKITPNMSEMGINLEKLQPWLSNPRITYTPMSLAILLDSIFFELRDQNKAANELIERDEWRDLIKHNEEAILKPFFQRINGFFSAHHKSDFLLREFYYGKD